MQRFLPFLLSFAFPLAGGQLTGRVVDSTGAVLPGVTVEANASSESEVTVSSVDGTYVLLLPPGVYDVSFRLMNFGAAAHRITVGEGRTTLDQTLLLSASADIVVTAKQTFRDGTGDAASVGVVTAEEIARRPYKRAGEALETVPGVVVTQHSGEGKANQYYLRGFNLDHGTDLAITVAGVPVNMPTHAHGQGYADANFLIPELIGVIQYEKGPYSADQGDFASAGAVNVSYLNVLDAPVAELQGGTFGYRRALFAASPKVGAGVLLLAVEGTRNEGPWVQPDDYRRTNLLARYSRGGQLGGWSITAASYAARWASTDQVPQRAVEAGVIDRFGNVDSTNGGETSRSSLAAEWQRATPTQVSHVSGFAMRYRMDLFSNFTYFLDDPVNGDQFEQEDERTVFGARGSHRWAVGRAENTAGLQLRRDDIDTVGLYRTAARVRLGTVREDAVTQTSGALFAESSMQWRPRLRTILGLRADRFRFDVNGSTSAAIVNPKLSVIAGPWRNTELYANAGGGFHSNDGRSAAEGTPLVRTRGAELGARTTLGHNVTATAVLWGLDMASELVFVGDAGTTEAGRPSRRTGVEVSAKWSLTNALAVDAEWAYSRARFRDTDVLGAHIPGAVEGVVAAGLSLADLRGFSGELRYRWFGPRPLIEDDSVRSEATSLVSARGSYAVSPRISVNVDVFNLLNSDASDVDYFYASRLRDEPAAVEDVHFHPVEGRSIRLGLSTTF